MGDINMYYDENFRLLNEIDVDIVKPHWYSRNHIDLKHTVIYSVAGFPAIRIEPGRYNGFSVPRLVMWTPFIGGLVGPLMPVWQATLPHDVVCPLKNGRWTSQMKRQIFEIAYQEAIQQFYDGKRPDKLSRAIISVVNAGSKYFGYCR